MPPRFLLPGMAALLGTVAVAECLAPAPPLPLRPFTLPRPPAGTPGPPIDRWAATVLARPLFSPSRRPDMAAAGQASSIARLTAIIIGQGSRSAIFAPEGGKPRIVQEGGVIDGYRLSKVRADSVELSAPGGMLMLRPEFPASAAPLSDAAESQPPSVADIDNEP